MPDTCVVGECGQTRRCSLTERTETDHSYRLGRYLYGTTQFIRNARTAPPLSAPQ
jgi:hypothetical protein